MIHIKQDVYGDLHLIQKTGPYENGRLIITEDDARWLAQNLLERFEQQDRNAIAQHLTPGIEN